MGSPERPEPPRLPDLDPESIRALAERAVALAVEYLSTSAEGPVLAPVTAADLEAIRDEPLPALGQPLSQLFEDLNRLAPGLRHNIHPRFFGYVNPPGTPLGAFADLIASAWNQNLTAWRSAPAAVTVERRVISWLASLVGWPGDAAGLLTSGGSMATLTALAAARDDRLGAAVGRHGMTGLDRPPVLYMSDEGHVSIPKAAALLGIGREGVRVLPTGEDFTLDPGRLAAAVDEDRAAGRQPFAVVANAGSVNTGAVDPLEGLADVCWEKELWLHVDGAYGALASTAVGLRSLFRGIDSADSVTLDPHKWLYANLDAGCVLLKDEGTARRAFATDAAYAEVMEGGPEESFAFFDLGPEMSRRFRALKLWLTLKHYGTEQLASSIVQDITLARYLQFLVEESPELELLCPARLSVVCFRYVPSGGAPEEELERLNRALVQRLQHGGGTYLSSTRLRGRFTLRACLLNPRTESVDLDRAVREVVEAGRALARS